MSQPFSMTSLFSFLLCLSVSTFAIADDSFSVGTDNASVDESQAFDLINRFRADPQGELARMFSELSGTEYTQESLAAVLNNAPTPLPSNWWKDTFNEGSFSSLALNSMDFFGTDPAVLQAQFDALPEAGALFSYRWNGNVGWAAIQYANCVEMDGGASPNPHAVSGAPGLGARFTDSGYTGWNNVGENIAANFDLDILTMHLGFVVDWGNGTDGIQDGAGHRTSMLGGTGANPFTEMGIGIVDNGWEAGKVTQVQHFGNQFAEELLAGYAFKTGESYNFDNASATAVISIEDVTGEQILATTPDQWGGFSFDLSSLNFGTYNLVISDTINNVAMSNTYEFNHSGERITQLNVTAASEGMEVLLGDANQDGVVNLLDVAPFVELVSAGQFLAEADLNQDGIVNLLDVQPFVEVLSS